eukprot:gnl/MRDRNA2_/MRDRNA2_80641_c0_seq3.p1 gnl/MRDRNA2_/MRDRNA2_80641_c0~~gnl/MRDRNA2_/MRDRNA2_80641_c0_seq3.p1  ORF type:complete len:105 (+),score=7.05 gnl/MRDRNA2_/MRDRNA2_80641_c0_seq3:129-443(+)
MDKVHPVLDNPVAYMKPDSSLLLEVDILIESISEPLFEITMNTSNVYGADTGQGSYHDGEKSHDEILIIRQVLENLILYFLHHANSNSSTTRWTNQRQHSREFR